MTDIDKRIGEIEKDIAAKSERIGTASPDKRVEIEKDMEIERALLEALERSKAAQAKEPTEAEKGKAALLEGLREYERKHDGEVEKYEKQYAAMSEKLRKAQQELEKAEAGGDLQTIADKTRAVHDIRQGMEYAEPMISKARAARTFPSGAVAAEWEKAAESSRSEWDTAVEDVRAMRAGYLAAVQRLEKLRAMLTDTRQTMGAESMQRDGVAVTFRPILTAEAQASRERGTIDHPFPFLDDLEIRGSQGMKVGDSFRPGLYGEVPL